MTPRDGALSLRRRHPADRTAAITGWIPVPLEKHNGTNGEKNQGVGVGSSLYWDCFVENQPLVV